MRLSVNPLGKGGSKALKRFSTVEEMLIMLPTFLQQTRVETVRERWPAFLARFPDLDQITRLAVSPQGDRIAFRVAIASARGIPAPVRVVHTPVWIVTGRNPLFGNLLGSLF